MNDKKVMDSALAVALSRPMLTSYEVSEDFMRDASQYHRKQVVENKVNPVAVRPRLTAIERANQRERDELVSRRESKANAERRLRELFE